MAPFYNTCDVGSGGGTTGGPVTAGNSVGGGTAATEILLAGAGSVIYDTTHIMFGTHAWKIVAAGGTDKARGRWDFTASNVASMEFFIYFEAFPGIAQTLCSILNTSFSGMTNIAIDSSNRLLVQSKTGTIKTFTALSLNTWYRVELSVRLKTGTTTDGETSAAYYLGNSATPVEAAFTSTTTDVGTLQALRYYIGGNTAGSTLTCWIDYAGFDPATDALMGPINFTATFTWSDSIGLSDTNVQQSISNLFTLSDNLDLLDQFNLQAGITYQFGLLDRANLTDTFILNYGNNYYPTLTDVLGLTDSVDILSSNPYAPKWPEFINLADSFNLAIQGFAAQVSSYNRTTSFLERAFFLSGLSRDPNAQGSTQSLERDFYLLFLPDNSARYSLADLRRQYYQDYLGYQNEFEYFRSRGYTGSLSDMKYQYYLAQLE